MKKYKNVKNVSQFFLNNCLNEKNKNQFSSFHVEIMTEEAQDEQATICHFRFDKLAPYPATTFYVYCFLKIMFKTNTTSKILNFKLQVLYNYIFK